MRTPIPMETIESVWDDMAEMGEEEAGYIMAQMEHEQPILQTYLLAVDEEFTEDEQQTIFFLGVVLWQIMKRSKHRLSKVTEERIDKVDERNFSFFNSLDPETADLVEITERMLEEYPEPNALSVLIEALMEKDDPEDLGIRDELTGLAFFHLKTALDAMIASLRG